MKSLINMRAGAMMLMLMFLSGTSAWADVDDYLLSVRDVTHTANTIEFNLYLLDEDDGQTFEFAALQMGLLLNSSIYGVGTVTVSYSNAGSGLDGDQQFVGSVDVVGSLTGYPGRTVIRLMPNSIPPVPPGAGSGTEISSTGDGTFLARFTITSSVSFTSNTRPDLIFCASSALSPLFPTVLSSYINGDATSLVVTPGLDAIVDGNPLLNATLPALFNVTGTGAYCQGGAALPVGLDGSEADATYTLYHDGLEPETYSGTGAALSFGLRTAGTYTVIATNAAGDMGMDGQAVITETPNNTITLTSAAGTNSQSVCINAAIADITYSTTGATGATFSGLPVGVDGAWTTGTVTISGTPTVAGTDNYTVTLTGGCGTVSATGTITVNPLPAVITGTTAVCAGSTTDLSNSTPGGEWSSQNTGVATVDATGLVTGVLAGTAEIRYTLPTGCYVTATVTVNPLPTVSITGSNSICVGATTTLSPTTGGTWSSSNTSVASVSAIGVVTGVASGTATFTFTSATTGCSSTTAAITVNLCSRSLTLSSVFLQGLYESYGTMRQAVGDSGPQWPAGIADHITVELHSSSSYATIIYTATEVELTTLGTAVVTIPAEHSGSYYITVKHRNSVETTTATAVSFSGTTVNYSFLLQSAAYSGNMGSSGDGRFLIFSGDVNQDGFVDTEDYLGVDNDAYNYLSGYLVTDVDGNGTVDTNDYIFIDNNNYNYVGTIHP